jgi:hypothetical protein
MQKDANDSRTSGHESTERVPSGEPFPGETLIADGWVYRDLPRMTQETMNTFLDIVGEENTRFLTFARYKPQNDVRGQLLISPAGMDRMKAYSAAKKEATP